MRSIVGTTITETRTTAITTPQHTQQQQQQQQQQKQNKQPVKDYVVVDALLKLLNLLYNKLKERKRQVYPRTKVPKIAQRCKIPISTEIQDPDCGI